MFNFMANETDVKSDPSTEKPEQTIPYERFKEVVEERNQDRQTLAQLKEEIETLKTSLPKPEEPEPADWKEVKERAVREAMAKLEEKQAKQRQEEEEQERVIESGFQKLEALGQKITPEIRRSVLTEMVKTGDDVYDTFLKIKAKTDKTEKVEQLKQEAIPEGKGTDNTQIGLTYKQLHSMSIDDIIAKAEGKK